MLIDLDSYIRQILPPTWRDAQSVGLAKVLFQPIVALFRKQEKYQEEVFFRAGLTGQKIVLEYYLQSVVDGRITIQDEDGTIVDFSVIVPSTLTALQEKQVYDIVSAYKLGGKRFEVRDVFASATLPEEPSFMEWTTGFPKLENSTLFTAVSQTGSFITRVRYQGNSLYLIDGAYNYQAGVAVNLGDYRLDRTIEVQVGELSATIEPRPEYTFEISSVEKIPSDTNGAWRINFTEAYKGQRNFTIQWYKGTATVPISTYSTGSIDTNQVSYLYFNPKQDDPWKILTNGPGAYRVVVKVTVDGLNYSDEANATFSSADLGGATSGRVDFTRVYKVGLLLYPHNYASFATTRVKAVADGYKAAGLDTMQVTFSPFLAKKYDTGAEDWSAYDEMISYICNTKGLFLAPKLDAGFSAFALDNGKADGGSIKSAWLTHMIVNPADAGEILGPKHDISTPPMQLYMGFVESFRNRYHSYYEQGKILYASIGLDDNQEGQYPFKNIPSPDNATYKARLVALRSVLEEFLRRLNGWDACWDTGCACDNLAVGARNTLAFRYLSRGFLWVRSGNDIPFEIEYGPGGREFADNFALSVTSQTGQYLIVEYTKTGPSYSVSAYADAVSGSIDRGVAGVNNSFFESELSTGDPDLTTIRTTMQANGRWTKPRVTPVFQGRQSYSIDQARAGGSVMNGAIRNAYTSTKNSQGGVPPRVEVYYPTDEGGGTPSPNPDPNPNPNPSPVANNASIESASDWQTTTIRAKLTGTPQGSYNIRVLRNGNEVATAVATYGSNGYVEFSFPSVVSGQDLRGQVLSFAFSGSTSQTIEYFLPRLVFREFTPNYSNFADDKILIHRLTKTFAGEYLVADIGENRGWLPEYYINGGNGGDAAILPNVAHPVEKRIEIAKVIVPNVERWQIGGNYRLTAPAFWIKVRVNYTPKGLWVDEKAIGKPRMFTDANSFTLPSTKKYNRAFDGVLKGVTNEEMSRVSWSRSLADLPLWWYTADIRSNIQDMGVTSGEGGFHTWSATSGGRLQEFANRLKDALNAKGKKIIITDWEPGEIDPSFGWMWNNDGASAQVQWIQSYLATFGMQFYEWHQGNSFNWNDKVYELVSPSGHWSYTRSRPSNNTEYGHNAEDYINLFANIGSVTFPNLSYMRAGNWGYNNVLKGLEQSYPKPANKRYHATPYILFAMMTTNFVSLKSPGTKLISILYPAEDQDNRQSMTQQRFKAADNLEGFVRAFDMRYVYSQNLMKGFFKFLYMTRNVYLLHVWSTADSTIPYDALFYCTKNGAPSCGSNVNKGYNFEGNDSYACPSQSATYVGNEAQIWEALMEAGDEYVNTGLSQVCDGVNNQLSGLAFEYRNAGQSTWVSVAASNGDEHITAWKFDRPFITRWINSANSKHAVYIQNFFGVPYAKTEVRFVINSVTYTRILNGNEEYTEVFNL